MSYANIESLMQRGMWDDAIVECKAVTQVQPMSPMVWAYMGMCHFRKQEWEDASAALRRAVILDPKFLDAGIRLAQALDKCGRHLEAYDVAADFLKQHPGNNTLKGLTLALEHHLRERRLDNWERSTRAHTVMIEHE